MKDDDDSSEPTFSEDSLKCHTSQFGTGKVVSVIVDGSAGMIHFRNCYRRNWSLALRAHTWFSCPLTDLRYARHLCHKGNCALTITSATGIATISSKATNYEALREMMATVIPPVRGLIRDSNDVLGLVVFGAIGGFLVSLFAAGWLLPRNASGATFGMSVMGGVVSGVVLAVLFGNWLLNRKYQK